jgi:hypothetical protein
MQSIVYFSRSKPRERDLMPITDINNRIWNLVLEDSIMDLFFLVSETHDATSRRDNGKSARDESFDPSEGNGVDEVELLELVGGVDGADDGIVAFQRLSEFRRGFGNIYNGDLESAVFEDLDVGLVNGGWSDEAGNVLGDSKHN